MRILKDGYQKKSNKEITLLLLVLGFIESDHSDLITSNCHTFTKIYMLKRIGQDNKLMDILKKDLNLENKNICCCGSAPAWLSRTRCIFNASVTNLLLSDTGMLPDVNVM